MAIGQSIWNMILPITSLIAYIDKPNYIQILKAMSNKQLGIFFDSVIPQFVERRKNLGLSQSRLDEMIGCARGLVSKWEVGIRKPSGFLFCCWANALECHIKIKPKETESKSEHTLTH